MKRGAPLFSKKFLRNAAIVLVIAVVAYVVMYGVREGFQASKEVVRYAKVTKENASTLSLNLPRSEFPAGTTRLTGMKFYGWGPALTSPTNKTGWSEITRPAAQSSSTWQVLTLGDATNKNCIETDRDSIDGHIDASKVAQCKFSAADNKFALKTLNKSIYIKYAPKMTQFNTTYSGTSKGIKSESISDSNLAVVYTFE
jgi:hypothetical protein